MSQLPSIISEPQSADADTQDGKDEEEGVEKEAETYENVFEYLTTHRVHQKLRRAFLEECRRSSKLWMESSITKEKKDS